MTQSQPQRYVNPRVLKINVGFLLAQSAGYQRETELDLPCVRVSDDVDLDFLRGMLCLSRNSRRILVQGTLHTQIVTECGRCVKPLYYPVELSLEELFSSPPSADTVYAVDEAGNLDLAPLLREEAILAVPMGVFCGPDCAGLCPKCGQNLNEAQCDCKDDDIDPRLAILAQFNQRNRSSD